MALTVWTVLTVWTLWIDADWAVKDVNILNNLKILDRKCQHR